MDEIYKWLDIFEPMIEQYKSGNITADEVLNLIDAESKNFQPMSRAERYLEELY